MLGRFFRVAGGERKPRKGAGERVGKNKKQSEHHEA